MIINLDLFSPLAAFKSKLILEGKKPLPYSFVGYFVNLKFIHTISVQLLIQPQFNLKSYHIFMFIFQNFNLKKFNLEPQTTNF